MNHTPQQTDTVFNILVKTFPAFNFIDSSWHNDAADSLEITNFKVKQGEVYCNKYRIWMPSPEEDINIFCIEVSTETNDSEFTDYDTIEQVIERLKTITA